MLSICIPTYNYDVRPLVAELHWQCTTAGISFEILVADDCSPNQDISGLNKEINQLPNVQIFELDKNQGRSGIRNLLASKASYDQLLFLDCDTFPEKSDFIQNYFNNQIENGVVIGGLVYRNEKPSDIFSLRWNYGHQRETVSAEIRTRNPYGSFMTGNFLIAKSVFEQMQFDETVVRYGHEDTLFGILLEQKNISINHISNRVFHDGLETNSIFIQKTKAGIKNLFELTETHHQRNIIAQKIKLLRTFQMVKKVGMAGVIGFWFVNNEKNLVQKLDSPNPNLRLFDWFKLGYLCILYKNR
jgi:glycosyltransferase involved in cell wall biosynthesis